MYKKISVTIAALGLVLATAVSSASAPARTMTSYWKDAFSTDPVHVNHSPRPVPRVTNLRVAEHPSASTTGVAFDRVVVDIHGKMPGYDVRFVKHLVEDGSGTPVDVKGKKFVQITLTPAYTHKQDGSPTYEGPDLAEYDFHPVRGLAFLGDFEGYVTFGVGLRYKAPFRVFELKDPNGPDRLVVDFRRAT
jgi:hypothetical protein